MGLTFADFKAREPAKSRRFRLVSEPYVTDHALLRFMERALGIDVEALRSRILTPAVREAIRGRASAVEVEGVTFVVCDAAIVTTLEEHQIPLGNKDKRIVQIEDADFRAMLAEFREAMA
jgi:hypothetical protein